jgi:type 1 fimbria pilin
MMSCKTPPAAQEVTITSGAGEFPMNSRIVIGKGKTVADVGTGAVTAPVTFTITYP